MVPDAEKLSQIKSALNLFGSNYLITSYLNKRIVQNYNKKLECSYLHSKNFLQMVSN